MSAPTTEEVRAEMVEGPDAEAWVWAAFALPIAEHRDALAAEVERLKAQKNAAYNERDRCVALIARMALALGFRAGLGRHEGGIWEDDWRWIVFVDLPSGQVSWHIHDSEVPLVAFLCPYEGAWDGHTTDEKYLRCEAPIADAAQARAVAAEAEVARMSEALRSACEERAVLERQVEAVTCDCGVHAIVCVNHEMDREAAKGAGRSNRRLAAGERV